MRILGLVVLIAAAGCGPAGQRAPGGVAGDAGAAQHEALELCGDSEPIDACTGDAGAQSPDGGTWGDGAEGLDADGGGKGASPNRPSCGCRLLGASVTPVTTMTTMTSATSATRMTTTAPAAGSLPQGHRLLSLLGLVLGLGRLRRRRLRAEAGADE